MPKKGATITLDEKNILLYERIITSYEGHTLDLKADGTIEVDGKPTTTYTFAMDYYFMLGDNRHKSADSRYWGFVPEDHIVGKPLFVWLSLDPDKSFLSSIRWNRFFMKVK
jgi:signal peptidase I